MFRHNNARKYYFYPHFIDEKTAQHRLVTCPKFTQLVSTSQDPSTDGAASGSALLTPSLYIYGLLRGRGPLARSTSLILEFCFSSANIS